MKHILELLTVNLWQLFQKYVRQKVYKSKQALLKNRDIYTKKQFVNET